MQALRAALLLLLAARLPGGASAAREVDDVDDADDDSDSAPFMLLVEHVDQLPEEAKHCSGSLVSLRTGVTSAECARGPGELWVLAAATAAGLAPRAAGARRVSRLATAGPRQVPAGEWSGALLELAVLELEAPFDGAALARPILMATAPHECLQSSVCHVVRALASQQSDHARLRIVDATLVEGATCAELVPQWPLVRERALCLTGPELCRSERGAGVVCGGKLCGVVVRSAGGRESHLHCGYTHAAQSVARWRRFLHCAHTLRACGRGSCTDLCSEKRLIVDAEEGGLSSTARSSAFSELEPERDTEREADRDAEGATERDRDQKGEREHAAPHMHPVDLDLAHIGAVSHHHDITKTMLVDSPTRVWSSSTYTRQMVAAQTEATAAARSPTRTSRRATQAAPRPATPAPARRAQPAPLAAAPAPRLSMRKPETPLASTRLPSTPSTTSKTVRPTPLFEPNRPDFRAGEYGDNAAEYGGPAEDGAGGNSSAAPSRRNESRAGEPPAAQQSCATPRASTEAPAHTAPSPSTPPAPRTRPATRLPVAFSNSQTARAASSRSLARSRLARRAGPPPGAAARPPDSGRASFDVAAKRTRPEYIPPQNVFSPPPSALRPLLTSLALPLAEESPSIRPAAAVFEPNRPDFEAGAYGDNAVAEYAEQDERPSPPTAPPSPLRATRSVAPGVNRSFTRYRSPTLSTLPVRRTLPSLPPPPVRLSANHQKSAASSVRIARVYSMLIFSSFYFSNR